TEGRATSHATELSHEASHLATAATSLLQRHDLLHHLLSLFKLREELVDILRRGAAAACNTSLATAIDDVGIVALERSHRENDGLSHFQLVALKRLFKRGIAQRSTHTGDALKEIGKRAHVAYLAHLLQEIR